MLDPTRASEQEMQRFLEAHDELAPDPLAHHPGKYQACAHQALGERLHGLSLIGWLDEETGAVDGPNGWVARMGRFLLFEDSNGFFTYTEYDRAEEADDDFQAHVRATNEEYEPDEDDAYMRPAGPLGARIEASFAGRFLGHYDDEDHAMEAITREGRAARFYPNVWYVDDHGGMHLREDVQWELSSPELEAS